MRTKSTLAFLSALLVLGLVPLAAAGKGVRVKGGVVHACLKTNGKKGRRGTIRIVNAARQCKKKRGEQALTWSLLATGGGEGAVGPQGPAGPTGATGPGGPPGNAASPTVFDELQETVAGQNKEIEALLGKVGSLTGELLDLEKGVTRVEGSVTDLGHSVDHSLTAVKTELSGTIGELEANVVNPLVGKVGALEPLTAKVAALEPLSGKVAALEPLTGKVTALEPLLGKVAALEPLTGKVAALEPLTAKVEALEPLLGKVAALEPLTGEVGVLKTATDSLTTAVGKQCASLGEVAAQTNGLGGALNELLAIGALKTLLGGILPKVPENSKAVTC